MEQNEGQTREESAQVEQKELFSLPVKMEFEKAVKWSFFLAIVGLIGGILYTLYGFIQIFGPIKLLAITTWIMAGIMIIISYYLISFSKKIKTAVNYNNEEDAIEAFLHLKNYFIALIISFIVSFVVSIISSMVGAFSTMNTLNNL